MPQPSKSSRRRLVTDRNQGENKKLLSSGAVAAAAVGKQKQHPLPSNNDNGKARKKHRAGYAFRRSAIVPYVCTSGKASRACLTFFVAVAMTGVAVGIMVGIGLVVAPSKPEARIVTIERSGYKYNKTEIETSNTIVLGRRPSPPPEEEGLKHINFYQHSELEAYVMENGRTLGYDKQIAKDPLWASQSPGLSSTTMANVWSVFKTIQKQNSGPPHVDYGDPKNTQDMPSGCELWMKPEVTNPEIYRGLETFRDELEAYDEIMLDWTWDPPKLDSMLSWGWNSETPKDERAEAYKDLRDFFDATSSNKNAVCKSLEIHPQGLEGIFTSQMSLSRLPNNNKDGETRSAFLEPFLPPLRHPEFCHTHYELQKQQRENKRKRTNRLRNRKKNDKFQHLENTRFFDTGYIVHDFAAMCRNNIYKHSRTVFVDVGKPFGFRNPKVPKDPPPSLGLLDLYRRFGIVFDHVYGYGAKPWDISSALKEIPDILKAAYHDFNAGIDSNLNSYANPFKIISEAYKPDDFVVVVLNTNNAQGISIPLAHQLLVEELNRTSSVGYKLSDLIDVFYFSHHFTMKEMTFSWKDSMRGASMQDSMEFFASLREHGIAAHYWI